MLDQTPSSPTIEDDAAVQLHPIVGAEGKTTPGEYVNIVLTEPVSPPQIRRLKKGDKRLSATFQRIESLGSQTKRSLQNQARGIQIYFKKQTDTKLSFKSWWRKIKTQIGFDPNNFTLIYLIALGCLTATIGFLMDIMVEGLQNGHKMLMNVTSILPFQYILWQFYFVIFCLFALFFTKKVSIHAAGSGIPEMKSILSGNTLERYLTIRTFIAKVVGLTTVVGCGMIVGKEGPFVHTASIIANQLAKLSPFRAIKMNQALKQQMLAAACGAGVASNFGAPVGGVLFSIEVTSTYYPVRNYYYVFLAASSGGLLFRLFWGLWSDDRTSGSADTIPTNFPESTHFQPPEIIIFAVLGVIGGMLGVIFVRLNMIIFRLKSAYNTHPKLGKYFQNNLLYTVAVCILTGIFTFPGFYGDFMGLGVTKALRDLVSTESLTEGKDLAADEWGKGPVMSNLFYFVTFKFFLCLFSISLPMPLGLYTPLLMIGAGVGRFLGEGLALSEYFESSPVGGYAVVGAAAMAAGATQTLSTMVIVFELTGQLTHLAPVMIATMVAYFVSKKFTVSIYDAILLYRGLPYLPDLKHVNYDQTAKDLMQKNVSCLSLKNTYSLSALLQLCEDEHVHVLGIIPIIDDQENGHIIGYIQRDALEQALARQEKAMPLEASPVIVPTLKGPHQLSLDFGSPENELFVVYFPSILVTESTPFTEIHMLFINLRLQFVLVTNNAKLAGVVTREGMLGILLENV